jgi:hypothetical protein
MIATNFYDLLAPGVSQIARECGCTFDSWEWKITKGYQSLKVDLDVIRNLAKQNEYKKLTNYIRTLCYAG